jgi:hypothetical protein
VLAGAANDVITISPSDYVLSPFDYAPDSYRLIDGGSGFNKIVLQTVSNTDAATLGSRETRNPIRPRSKRLSFSARG